MKRGAGPDKEAMKTDLTACADQFLATKYATCNAMMKTEDAEKKDVMECYIKVSDAKIQNLDTLTENDAKHLYKIWRWLSLDLLLYRAS